MGAELVAVMDVGGTHVTAAVVEPDGWAVRQAGRTPLDSNAGAEQILGAFVAAGAALPVPEAIGWGVAMPDPFDYPRGIATFHGVGKFEAIYGMDIRSVLMQRLPQRPSGVAFLNDADAFALGEWTGGAAAGCSRCVGITLGTGVGSGWLVDGQVVDVAPGVPPHGRAHHLVVDGAGLEETMSRRAIRRAYAAATGDDGADVRDIAERAAAGETAAAEVLRHALSSLGAALGPGLREFGAEVIVLGGSMAASWPLFEPWFRTGLDWPDAPPIRVAQDIERAALVGAAHYALDVLG
jgi:glucokinase